MSSPFKITRPKSVKKTRQQPAAKVQPRSQPQYITDFISNWSEVDLSQQDQVPQLVRDHLAIDNKDQLQTAVVQMAGTMTSNFTVELDGFDVVDISDCSNVKSVLKAIDPSRSVVVVFKQAELCQGEVLERVLLILHDINQTAEFQIKIVIGCSVGLQSLKQSGVLTLAALRCLSYKRFYQGNTMAQVDALVDKLYLSDGSQMLPAHVLGYLVDVVQNSKASYQSFVSMVKYVHMSSHYQSLDIEPLQLKSLRSHIQELAGSKTPENVELAKQLLDGSLQINVTEKQSKLKQAFRVYYSFFSFIKSLSKKANPILEHYGQGGLAEFYSVVLAPSYTESQEMKSLLRFIMVLDGKALAQLQDILFEVSGDEFYQKTVQHGDEFKRDLREHLETYLKTDLQVDLGVMNERAWLCSQEKNSTTINRLKQAFQPCTREILGNGMTYPKVYLGCDDSQHEDIQVAYMIYQESGKLINIHDWFTAFSSIQDPRECNQDQTYARFLRCVMELQLMGYIKKTGRKVDHVQRLIW